MTPARRTKPMTRSSGEATSFPRSAFIARPS
jgi:hypothetical protein